MIKKIYTKYVSTLEKLTDVPLLAMRGVLVYVFYMPAIYKVTDFSGTAVWFESLGIPLPTLNAYLAGITEISGVVLLTLGLGTRIIALPMIITMLVAIFSVHIENGFNASDNGFELPFYFIIMLLTLMIYGPGRLSLDHWISSRKK